jgi:Skp family chaperone for outer membrane proteins
VKFNFLQSLLFAAGAGLMLVLPISVSAQAQQTSAGRICVLDVAKVFKDNASFQSQMEGIRSDATTLKSTVEAQLAELQNQAKGLEEYDANSEKRRELERELVSKQAELQTRARQAEAELLTREAKIYLDTYKEMEQVVAKLAEQYSISLVLRYESAPINPDDRTDVIKGVNRQVVYQADSDLTRLVSEQMTGSAAAPAQTQTR